jgi:DNA-binding transcriptional MerR regulator
MTKRTVNYLNNKDLLLEIHRSKNSYSSFTNPEYHQYDLILPSIDKINVRSIAEAKRVKAKRLSQELHESTKLVNPKAKLADSEIDYKKIDKSDIIFRIMSFDHIPDAPGRKKSVKTVADGKEKVNFPPFQHWKFDDNDQLICVGKSHWKGDLTTGHFSKDHGRITNNLAKMFIKLCERYATRGNVRNYTYNDEMRGQAILQLTQIGLQFDESKSDNPFAYYTAAVTNAFVRVINLEKKVQTIRDDMLEMYGMNPSSTRIINHEYEANVRREEDSWE